MTAKTAKKLRPPPALDKEARAEWRRVIEELTKANQLEKVSRSLLITYIRTWSLCEAAAADISAKGLTVEHPNHQIALRPSFRALTRLTDQLIRLISAMRLSPASASTREIQSDEELKF